MPRRPNAGDVPTSSQPSKLRFRLCTTLIHRKGVSCGYPLDDRLSHSHGSTHTPLGRMTIPPILGRIPISANDLT
jgi:hypothetical protein